MSENKYIDYDRIKALAQWEGAYKVVYELPHMVEKDVEKVVRCKNCKYREEHHYEEKGEQPYIKYECKFTKYSMSDDGFCSFGKAE